MPRVRVIADDGWVAFDERICAVQAESEHYRHQLAERIQWAVADAEQHPVQLRSLPDAGSRTQRTSELVAA